MMSRLIAVGSRRSPNLIHGDRFIRHVQAATYRSQYCIDALYPEAVGKESQRQISHVSPQSKLSTASEDEFTGFIPIEELTITHCRSSGPGGQNVNKVNTKVEIRFHVESAKWIPDVLKPKLLQAESNRITKDGYLVIKSERTRSQILNQADCLDRLRAMIRDCDIKLYTPSPEQLDLIKQRQSKAKASILKEKKQHSMKKRFRNSPSNSEF